MSRLDHQKNDRKSCRSPLWLGLILLLSSCTEDSLPFQVEKVTPSGQPLRRNEEIRIRFSEAIKTPCPIAALVSLHDAADREVDADVSIAHDTVVLAPRSGEVWPKTHSFRIEVKRGHGAPLRSRTGTPLSHDSTFHLRGSDIWVDDGRPFEVIGDDSGVLHDVRRSHIFQIRFSHAVDLRSIDGNRPGFLMQCRPQQGRGYTLKPSVTLSDDGLTAYVRPWSASSPFAPATLHQLIVHRRIRALNQRRLNRETVISFVTSNVDTFEGQLTFNFASDDLDKRENPDHNFSLPFARPVQGPIVSQGIFDDGRHEPSGIGLPFSQTPSRLQLILPGRRLGNEPGIITGFSWKRAKTTASDEVLDSVRFPRLLFRLGHADNLVTSTNFDDNFSLKLGPIHETVSADSLNGEWVWHPPAHATASRWVSLQLAHPFIYTGDSRDIVLEITNEEGGKSADSDWTHFEWATGEKPPRGTHSALEGHPNRRTGKAINSIFSTRIHMLRYLEVISKWQIAEISHPAYSLMRTRRSEDHILATGQENVDFRFWFQGVRLDENGQEQEQTEWEPLVTRLNGCKKMRVKIEFLPNPSRRNAALAEVRQFTIRYVEPLKDR